MAGIFGALEPWVALAVVAAMFAGFIRERFPPDVIALTGVAALLSLGILRPEDFVGAFANGAAVAIGALFILSGALVRTGALERVSELVSDGAQTAPRLTLVAAAAAVLVASAFMNNTPVVMVMIPVALQFAAVSGWAASRLLIPLSYAAILGGGCTLIGTSTNLLVDGVAQQHGLEPFSLFEITPVGIGVAVAGVAFMAIAGRILLPNRGTLAEFAAGKREQRYFTEVVIPAGSPLEGQRPKDVELFRRGGGKVIDVLRGDASLRRNFPDVTLRVGDRVVLRTPAQEVVGLRDGGLSVAGAVNPVSSVNTVTMEALVGPDSKLVGRILGKLRLRRRYGVYPLAVHRRGERAGSQLDSVRLQVGDTLLLEGDPNDIRRLVDEVDLIDLARGAESRPMKRSRAPHAIVILLGVVAVAALGLLPIAAAASIGVVAVLLMRILDPDEAFAFMDGRLLLLIVAMLAIGRALETSGAVMMIVDAMAPLMVAAPPLVALLAIFVLTSLLTEAVTNNVVAVVVTPVAIGLAESLGYDARAFVVAVMMGANASFATPISYQTNMLVYAPGGYRFADYLRLGVPLKLVTGVAAVCLISVFWPL